MVVHGRLASLLPCPSTWGKCSEGGRGKWAQSSLSVFWVILFWMHCQKFSQHHLPPFTGMNIIIRQNGQSHILQPAATLGNVLFDTLLKCFPLPVWVTSWALRFSVRYMQLRILFLFSCCTCVLFDVKYLARSPDIALPLLARVSYH